jgi:hypothetical protein
MTDDDLITLVREQRRNVQMDIPVEQIVGRGRALRARRRLPGVAAGALAVAAAAVLAVTALQPAGHQAGRPLPAQLDAWTVTKQANGAITVTVRQLRDPKGLQRTLRADGVPASVTFSGYPRACQRYPKTGMVSAVLMAEVFGSHGPPLVIHPKALPHGVGIQLSPGHYRPGAPIALSAGLVQASARCTGT